MAQAADGSAVQYMDGQRYLWLASATGPLVSIVGVALYFLSGGGHAGEAVREIWDPESG